MSFALASKPAVQAAARAARTSSAVPRVSAPVTRPAQRRVAVRATPAEEDPSVKLQQQLQNAGDWLKTRWEQTEDSEKPAAIAIIIGAVVAQIAIGATVDAVDRLPFIQQFLEFVGLAVVGVYGWRYITDPVERDNVKKSIDSFVQAVTGGK